MTESIHPSDEQLTAFFDKQLPDRKLAPIQDHVRSCSDCGAVLRDFATLQELGPVVEESMPSELYWEDLPDRVLARIAADTTAEVAPAASSPARVGSGAEPERSWWRALWTPAARWSAATAMVAVVGVVALSARDEPQTAPVAELEPTAADPATASSAEPVSAPSGVVTASMEPAEYAERIAHTLARDGNLGVQLDGTAGRAAGGYVGYSPIQTVSLGLMDSEFQNAMGSVPVVNDRVPRQPNPRWYFFTALRAEARGSCDLAQAGYHLARTQTDPQDPIHIASDAGLTRCRWRSAIAQSGNRGAETLARLRSNADERFAEHAAGHHGGCVKAWELWVAYLELGKTAMNADELHEGKAKLRSLAACVE